MIITGAKRTRKKNTAGQKQANQVAAAARAPVEHGFAALKNWRVLTRLRPRNQPLTDDHGRGHSPSNSTGTREPSHTTTPHQQFSR